MLTVTRYASIVHTSLCVHFVTTLQQLNRCRSIQSKRERKKERHKIQNGFRVFIVVVEIEIIIEMEIKIKIKTNSTSSTSRSAATNNNKHNNINNNRTRKSVVPCSLSWISIRVPYQVWRRRMLTTSDIIWKHYNNNWCEKQINNDT